MDQLIWLRGSCILAGSCFPVPKALQAGHCGYSQTGCVFAWHSMPLATQGTSIVLKRKGQERIVGTGAMIDSSAWLIPWLSFEIFQWAESKTQSQQSSGNSSCCPPGGQQVCMPSLCTVTWCSQRAVCPQPCPHTSCHPRSMQRGPSHSAMTLYLELEPNPHYFRNFHLRTVWKLIILNHWSRLPREVIMAPSLSRVQGPSRKCF